MPSGRSCSAWECTPATCTQGAELGGSGPALPVPSVPASPGCGSGRAVPGRAGAFRAAPAARGGQQQAAVPAGSRAGAGARHLPAPPRRARRRAGAPRRPAAAEPPCAGSGTSLRHTGAVRELRGRGQPRAGRLSWGCPRPCGSAALQGSGAGRGTALQQDIACGTGARPWGSAGDALSVGQVLGGSACHGRRQGSRARMGSSWGGPARPPCLVHARGQSWSGAHPPCSTQQSPAHAQGRKANWVKVNGARGVAMGALSTSKGFGHPQREAGQRLWGLAGFVLHC